MMAERKAPGIAPLGMPQKKKVVDPQNWTKSVLIVSCQFFPYVDWIDDKSVKKLLFTTPEVKQSMDLGTQRSYQHIETFDNFGVNCLVEYRAFELHKEHLFTHVVCLSEEDMIRCASLREAFSLPGQTLKSTMLFRDKVLMKAAVEAAGLKVPKYAPIEGAIDLIQFTQAHGFPVVVKPRRGYGSVNTTIIKTEDQLRKFLVAGLSVATDGPLELMVEAFVTGQMYHIDGYVYEGKSRLIWPSAYTGAVVNYSENNYIAAYSLLPTDPLLKRIQDYVDKTNIALAADGPASFPFHCEVWVTPQDEIVFCENASRAGGGGIPTQISALFGVTLRKKHLQFQLGIPLTSESDLVLYDQRKPLIPESAAWIYVYAKTGIVTLPSDCPFPCCLFYEPFYESGSVHTSRKSCGDAICQMIVKGATAEEVQENLIKVHEWFATNTRYDPIPEPK